MEKEEIQEQLKALNQAYNEVSQLCSDQKTSADEVGPQAFSLTQCIVFVSYNVLESRAT